MIWRMTSNPVYRQFRPRRQPIIVRLPILPVIAVGVVGPVLYLYATEIGTAQFLLKAPTRMFTLATYILMPSSALAAIQLAFRTVDLRRLLKLCNVPPAQVIFGYLWAVGSQLKVFVWLVLFGVMIVPFPLLALSSRAYRFGFVYLATIGVSVVMVLLSMVTGALGGMYAAFRTRSIQAATALSLTGTAIFLSLIPGAKAASLHAISIAALGRYHDLIVNGGASLLLISLWVPLFWRAKDSL